MGSFPWVVMVLLPFINICVVVISNHEVKGNSDAKL